MLYRIPHELYTEADDIERWARLIIAIANTLRDWLFYRKSEFLHYLNTGDDNIKQAMIGAIMKATSGYYSAKQATQTLDEVLEPYMQHDDEQPDEYTRLANTPWHYDEPDAKPKDDTVAEGLPHRTHDNNTPWPYDHGLFRPCCQADDD